MDRIWKILPLCLALAACGRGSGSGSQTVSDPPITYGYVDDIAYGNGEFVAVGNVLGGAGDYSEGVFYPWSGTSTDGVHWRWQADAFFPTLYGPETLGNVVYGSGGFIATPQGGGSLSEQLLISDNGLDWSGLFAPNQFQYSNVIWDGDEYLFSDGISFWTSADGVKWSQINITANKPSPRQYPTSIVKVAGVWYSAMYLYSLPSGVTITGIGSSTDLMNWTTVYQAPAGVTLQNTFHIGSNFVVLGTKGEVVTSLDGTAWTSQPIGTYPNLNEVAYNGSVYVGVDTQDSEAFYSSDGVKWTKTLTLTTDRYNQGGAGAVAAAPGGIFVIVGGATTDPYSFISPDGIHWAKANPYL